MNNFDAYEAYIKPEISWFLEGVKIANKHGMVSKMDRAAVSFAHLLGKKNKSLLQIRNSMYI